MLIGGLINTGWFADRSSTFGIAAAIVAFLPAVLLTGELRKKISETKGWRKSRAWCELVLAWSVPLLALVALKASDWELSKVEANVQDVTISTDQVQSDLQQVNERIEEKELPDGRVRIGKMVFGEPSRIETEFNAGLEDFRHADYKTADEHLSLAVDLYESTEESLFWDVKKTRQVQRLSPSAIARMYYYAGVAAYKLGNSQKANHMALNSANARWYPWNLEFLGETQFENGFTNDARFTLASLLALTTNRGYYQNLITKVGINSNYIEIARQLSADPKNWWHSHPSGIPGLSLWHLSPGEKLHPGSDFSIPTNVDLEHWTLISNDIPTDAELKTAFDDLKTRKAARQKRVDEAIRRDPVE